MKNPATRTETVPQTVLAFLIIASVLLALIFAIRYAGFSDTPEVPPTTPGIPAATLPDEPTSTQQTEQNETSQTEPITTTDTADVTQHTTAQATTTTVGTTPATTPTQTTTVGTTPATTPTQTTTAVTETTEIVTTAPAPVLDVSDEAMNELIEKRYLSIHAKSRPGYKLTTLKNIVVHYTGNPGSTAERNWLNFENNKPGTSAHFIIGLNGEIIQCIPLDEVAWAIGTDEGNYSSISIECCHPDTTGKFTDATYESLVRLVSWLCNELDLGRDDVIRHYDYQRYNANGVPWRKECPLYYANTKDSASHDRWENFKNDLILDSEPPAPPTQEPKNFEDTIQKRYLSVHPNSRPGYLLKSLNNIVVHYTANAGTTADQNWRNFENNKPNASSHFIIDLDGTIIQCMPLNEVAWAIGTTEGNYTSISIECCHPDATGKFTDATYESLVKLVSWLCNEFDLGRDKVVRHYDYVRFNSSGVAWHKQCPLYYANDADPSSHKRWEEFLNDLTID